MSHALCAMPLSAMDLLKQLENLALKEHLATVEFLVCLAEMDKRRAYLKLGYSSMFALCTRKLRYSEAAAYRRICSARIIRNFKEARRLLEARKVSLTTLSLIRSILSPKNAKEILESIAGQSREVVEKIVALQKEPSMPKRDSVRAIRVQKVVSSVVMNPVLSTAKVHQKEMALSSPAKAKPEQERTFANESKILNDPERIAQSAEVKFKINFEVSECVVKKLKRLREIRPYKNLEQLFELLLDNYLKRHAPENKRESYKSSNARVAPSGLRALVLRRDNYQCSFVGEDGERCTSRSDLEIDHICPIQLGGRTEAKNLRTLCAAHNRYEARRVFTEFEAEMTAH